MYQKQVNEIFKKQVKVLSEIDPLIDSDSETEDATDKTHKQKGTEDLNQLKHIVECDEE